MRPSGSSPMDVSAERQHERLRKLRDRFERTEPLRITPDGLKLWLDASVEPHPPSGVDASLRDDADRLRAHGLISADGDVPDPVRPAVDAVREPLCVLDVEAAVGRSPRHLRAWVGSSCAVLFGTDPPWTGAEPTAEAVASHDESPDPLRRLHIVPRDWPPMAAARWALITPRQVRQPAELTLPAESFNRRLVDHTTPVPDGAHARLAELWEQPMFTWGMKMSPTGDTVMILDAGNTGHRQVVADGDQVTLYALPSLALWDGVVGMFERALD